MVLVVNITHLEIFFYNFVLFLYEFISLLFLTILLAFYVNEYTYYITEFVCNKAFMYPIGVFIMALWTKHFSYIKDKIDNYRYLCIANVIQVLVIYC